MTKNDPTPKMAKMSDKWSKSTLCEIRAAWSGVFSIPGGTTGPGFKAEIRPPYFCTFFTILVIFILCIFVFLMFLHFDNFDDFCVLLELTFCDMTFIVHNKALM